MISIISLYFTALFKRLLALLFFCSFVPLILLSYSYPSDVILSILKDIALVSLPWLLWIHQAIFCGFITPQNTFYRIMLVVISTTLSTILLMGIFPHIQKDIPLEVDKILPNIVTPKGSIITTSWGTLVIDPNNLSQTLFATPTSKALWINENFLLFDSIVTNAQSFELYTPHSFQYFGYYPQQGVQVVPFFEHTPIFPQYQLGQDIIQVWFDNLTKLNASIKTLYTGIELPHAEDNPTFSKIHIVKEARTNITLERDPSMRLKPQDTPLTEHPPQNSLIIDYMTMFFSMLCIFTLASLSGIFSTLGQHLLGAISILTLLSLFVPSLSFYITDIQKASISPLLLKAVLSLILYACSVILLSLKNIKQESPQ